MIQPDFHQLPLRHYLGGEIRSTPTAVLEKLGRLPTGAHIWVASWPEALSLEDAQAREWLAGIGPAQKLPLPGYYQLTRLEPAGGDVWPEFAAERFRAWYRPFDIAGELAGFSDARRFSQLGFDNDGSVYRTAMRDAWLRLEGVAAGESVALSVAAEGSSRVAYYLKRGPTPDGLLDGPAVTPDAVVASNGKELSFRAPPGDESLWLGWKRAADSDTATPGLRVNWLAVEPAGAARNVASRP